MSEAILNSAHRAALAALADVVAPRTSRMPSAADLRLAEPAGEVDRVLSLRPDLVAPLCQVLDLPDATADPLSVVQRLASANSAAFAALMQAVAGAYYLHPTVRTLIGYGGQEALSLDRGSIGGEDFLAVMMERPPRWRQTSAPPEHVKAAP
jgi:hypothetical protein